MVTSKASQNKIEKIATEIKRHIVDTICRDVHVITATLLPKLKLSFIWIFSQLLLGSMKASLVLFIEPYAFIQSS